MSPDQGEHQDGENVAGETGSSMANLALQGRRAQDLERRALRERNGPCPCGHSVYPRVNGGGPVACWEKLGPIQKSLAASNF